MDEKEIIALYWARDERAIAETERRYAPFCRAIARNILGDAEEGEECLQDTWVRAWNAIPPNRPDSLRVFLGRITRNLALNRLRAIRAEKRGGRQAALALEELAECLGGGETPEEAHDRKEITAALDRFLGKLPENSRAVFLRRYWRMDSIAEIARWTGWSESRVSTLLYRLRGRLREALTEEGLLE